MADLFQSSYRPLGPWVKHSHRVCSDRPPLTLSNRCLNFFGQWRPYFFRSNQIKSLLLSHHHSTSALVSEILMSVLQTVQKNNRQFTYGQTVQKKNNKQFTYGQTVQKKTTTAIYIWTDSAKKTTTAIYIWTDSAKKTTAIYIWTVHIYRLYRRQCAKYTYMHSVRLVYYRDIL